jgi:hypothetical protein
MLDYNTFDISSYARVNLDGALDTRSFRGGWIRATPSPTPIAFFRVIAGLQAHPIWVMDRLALVVFCYSQHAIEPQVQVNLVASVVSDLHASYMVGTHLTWHTSREVRTRAESAIARLAADPVQLMETWPQQDVHFPLQMTEI